MLWQPRELGAALAAGAVDVLDCRFRLSDVAWGERAWAGGHIPGAIHADLDRVLSDLRRPGLGRHPLPRAEDFRRWLTGQGLRRGTPVVVYDDAGGRIAARAWWLLRHAGHAQVGLLDGGLPAWEAADLPLETRDPLREPVADSWDWGRMPVVESAPLAAALRSERPPLLLDARSGERFRGETEPLDRVAGHVPGAVSCPVEANLDGDCFLAPALLARRWGERLAGRAPAEVVHMCGSGVTACHNLFAMELAGLRGSALYAPSWSGWIEDADRPVATGA